jgi:hypothetical protein
VLCRRSQIGWNGYALMRSCRPGGRPACNPLWTPRVTASIMPCANRSSAHSNRSYSRANTSTPTSRPDAVSSGSSRAGTTCAAYIAASATVHRSNSKTCTQKSQSRRHAGCPPSGGVVVVIGDPPPARGQPATQRSMEAKPSICRNCRSVRRSRATSVSPAMTETLFQLKGNWMKGVCPLGAQVRTPMGRSLMPDSSTKLSVGLLAGLFIKGRPGAAVSNCARRLRCARWPASRAFAG